jgi:hypothetical protein
MKYPLVLVTLLAATVAPGFAQETVMVARSIEPQSMLPLHASTVIEARITTGRPYSAEATTEFAQTLGDGSKIFRKETVRIYRDGEGRTRREQLDYFGAVKFVSIYDPVSQVSYLLDPSTRTALKSAVRVVLPARVAAEHEEKVKAEMRARIEVAAQVGAAGRVALVAPADVPAQVAAEGVRKRQVEMVAAAGGRGVLQPAINGEMKEESLGQKVIDGVTTADGKRVTTVLPAGSIGNQQPITVVSEQWFSPELEILVMTRHSDPRTGETTYTVSNVARGDPGAGLFDVPAGYAVREANFVPAPAAR